MEKKAKSFDQHIVRIRVLSCVLVVLIHITHAYLYAGGAIESKKFIPLVIINAASRIGVPLFFMISGYLTLRRPYDPEKNRKKIIHYIGVLFIWSCLFLLWNTLFLHDDPVLNPIYYLFETARNHLWYLYDLIGLYIAFPFIQAMVHHMDRRMENMFLVLWLILAGGGRLLTRMMGLIGTPVNMEYMVPILQATYWLGYFIGGYLLYKRKDELKEKLSVPLLSSVFIGSILMITLLVCADSFEAHDFQDAFLTYGELFMMLSSTSAFLLNTRFKAKQHRLFDWFGPLTFGVYLIHPIFIDIAKEFIRFPWASALYIPLLLIVILIVSSLIVWVLSKLPGLKKIVS